MGIKINPKIAAASLFGLTLVGTSFVASIYKEDREETNKVAPTLVSNTRTFINITDKNFDGIPDWQESLNIPTIHLGGENNSATMTKTAALAVTLATQSYIGNTSGNQNTDSLLSQVRQESLDIQYDRSDIKVGSSNNQEILRTYGNKVAAITFDFAPPANTDNELLIVNRALNRNKAEILNDLDPIIESYEKMISAMLATEVPPSLVKEHLSLINVYNAILKDIKAFKNLFNDAFPAMARLQRYQSDTEALYLAISNLYLSLDKLGIKWNNNDIASRFIKIE